MKKNMEGTPPDMLQDGGHGVRHPSCPFTNTYPWAALLCVRPKLLFDAHGQMLSPPVNIFGVKYFNMSRVCIRWGVWYLM